MSKTFRTLVLMGMFSSVLYPVHQDKVTQEVYEMLKAWCLNDDVLSGKKWLLHKWKQGVISSEIEKYFKKMHTTDIPFSALKKIVLDVMEPPIAIGFTWVKAAVIDSYLMNSNGNAVDARGYVLPGHLKFYRITSAVQDEQENIYQYDVTTDVWKLVVHMSKDAKWQW